MRKLRIFAHISLDGVIQPGGQHEGTEFANGGWSAAYRSPRGAEALAETQGSGYDLLLGRTTYDLWAGYWPTMTTGPFAKGLNAATKYVATHRPDGLSWRPAQALGPDIVESVRRLKSEGDPDLIVWGSTTLTSLLLDNGLVDEVVLIVYPVLLGPGKRCFSESATARELALVSTKTTTTGVLVNTYRYVGGLPAKDHASNEK